MHGYKENDWFLQADDGVKLYCKAWKAETPRGILVIAHGLGEHCDRYHPLLEEIAGQHISVYALDHRGHGRSGGQKGHVNRFGEYMNDLHRFVQAVRQEEKSGLPLILFGHSMGGVIAFQYALTHPQNLDALVLSSAGLRPIVKAGSLKRAIASALSSVMPRFSMPTGLDPNLLTHDRSIVEAYVKDPLVHGVVSVSWYREFTRAGEECLQRAGELKMPLLLLHGKEDGIVDYHGSEEVMKRAASKDKEIFIFDGFYHETMNECPPENDKVLKIVHNWIDKHL